MRQNNLPGVAIVTGAAGFIGFHVCLKLIKKGWMVIGLDSMSDYYDVTLKRDRENILLKNALYSSIHEKIETPGLLSQLLEKEQPDIVIHLAAQAGVRYSIENPRSYLDSNIVGTFELLEAARANPPKHMLLASTSSAYGSNNLMPHRETDRADYQMSFYAATKKSTESMAHSYSHIFNLPITMFRFFTVYGPWGRPDMALFKFTKAILENKAIDVFNFGEMRRDFTYIDDLVSSIILLIEANPNENASKKELISRNESKSPVAPYRVVNIGNSSSEKLTDFIVAIEKSLGLKAKKNLLPIQPGDVPATWADTHLLETLTKNKLATPISEGVTHFINWYRDYYNV